MEGPLPAIGSTFLLILEHLLRHVPGLPAFLWEILVCVVMLVLMVKRGHTLRSVKALGKRCSARNVVCGKCSQNIGPMTQADDTLRPPGMEASPPTLQILCLSAINTNLSRLSLQAAIHLLEEVQKSQPSKPSQERQEMARQLWEEEQMNEELVERMTSLQTEGTSLLCENAQLESEIQQLKLKLQILPKFHEDHLRQLQKKLLEEERCCLEIEKKLPGVYRNMNSTCETRNLYKKVAEDARREVERTTSYARKGILFHAKRAQESWMAAVWTTRKLKELRRKNDRTRQMLAKVKSKSQPFPRGPSTPAAPPTAPRGPEMWGDPRGHQAPQQREGSHHEPSGDWGHLQV
ncbi:hypothetical protein HPG69_011411 [Diceros bicornis minor]|uniref:Uncharacterized protein n=1 Tax=Diceros bicornis minor TaxID=77932 RepID=A0A7J7FEA8_DICBM|nr:hypothetical protein HPG69_011411 [Diceros bicornis minor]